MYIYFHIIIIGGNKYWVDLNWLGKNIFIVFQAVTQNTASTHILVGLTQSVKIKIHESGKQILCVRKPDFTLKTATRYCLASWNISLKKNKMKSLIVILKMNKNMSQPKMFYGI